MNPMTVAVIFGGCSSEYSVSLESAAGVLSHLNRERVKPVLLGITPAGDWYHYTGDLGRIADDAWQGADCVPAMLSPNRSRHEVLVLHPEGVERIPIDVVLPILHGRNGEDGTVQGLCELAGIPVAGCGTLSSALCMDKLRAHQLVSLTGIRVPRSVELAADHRPEQLLEAARKLGYPLFVKPVRAGSSWGITRVTEPGSLETAVTEAFRYDSRVLLEEAIPGFEVGCAVLGNERLTLGELDEIELAGGFFNFTEKYQLLSAKIHVPARISEESEAALKAAARTVYRALDCRGFARVDFFLTPDEEIVFNEVNTIPGFTPHSRFPAMMAAADMPYGAVLEEILRLAVTK